MRKQKFRHRSLEAGLSYQSPPSIDPFTVDFDLFDDKLKKSQRGLGATALGSECIEFHITDSRIQFGTDQAASIEHSEELVRQINFLTRMLGDGVKKVYDSEIPIMKKLRNNG